MVYQSINGLNDAGRPFTVAFPPQNSGHIERNTPRTKPGGDVSRFLKRSGFVIFFVLFLACRKDFNSIVEPPPPCKVLAASRIMKPKSAVRLCIDDRDIPVADRSFTWSVNLGLIEGTRDTVTYYAPDTTGLVQIQVSVDLGETREVFATDLLIASQVVILKADDWTCGPSGALSGSWMEFVGFVGEKKIKANLGIIGRSLEKGDRSYLRLIRELDKSGNFEFWNHGYDHVLNRVDADGKKYSEFFNASLADQTSHILITQMLAKDKTGVVLHAFGAPGNAFDDNTASALRKAGEINVWFFGPAQSDKMVLTRRSEIEFPAHNPDFEKFMQTYDSTQTYQVYQIHPDTWDRGRFDAFRKIIDYLISRKTAFLTTQEYFRLIQTQ